MFCYHYNISTIQVDNLYLIIDRVLARAELVDTSIAKKKSVKTNGCICGFTQYKAHGLEMLNSVTYFEKLRIASPVLNQRSTAREAIVITWP